jgi:hypothetical protein
MTALWEYLMSLSDKELERVKLIVSMLGFLAVVLSLVFGFRQQRRAERWKLGEFIESQIKNFMADSYVRNALLMVDWGRRRINIYQMPNTPDLDGPRITRGIQWRALLPDDVKKDNPEYRDPEAEASPPVHLPPGASQGGGEDYEDIFTSQEAKIRETYDVLFSYLERFSNLIELKLVNKKYFEPYLRYWVESMAGNATPERDATWRFVLLTYVNFYSYEEVVKLFAKYGKEIGPDGKDYLIHRDEMINRTRGLADIDREVLADRLEASLKKRLRQTQAGADAKK